MKMGLSPGSLEGLIPRRMAFKVEISNQFARLLTLLAAGLVSTTVVACSLIDRLAPAPTSNADLLSLLESEAIISKSGSEDSERQETAKGSLKKSTPTAAVLTDPRAASAIQCIEGMQRFETAVQAADPTNYDQRASTDEAGNPVLSQPLLIILHETVSSEEQTLNYFRTPHLNDANQASYHVLIAEDGRRIRIVNDDQRAFGAGQSGYGNFTVRLKPGSAGSLNNVALHIGLVSPSDGRGDTEGHSGYTLAQYESLAGEILAWQIKYGIPKSRVTTHKAVDRSGTRKDPRSFNWDQYNRVVGDFAQQCGAMAYTQ